MKNLQKLSKASVILFCLACLSLSGCAGVRLMSIKDRAFVYAISFDQGSRPDRIKVAVQVPIAAALGSEGGGGQTSVVYEGEGISVADALQNIQNSVDRQLFIGFVTVLVFSEDVAKKGLRPYLDYFLRTKRVNAAIQMFITPGAAEELLKAKLPLEQISGQYLQKTFTNNLLSGQIPRADLGQFEMELAEAGTEAILPYGILSKEGKELITKGAAVFKEDRMVGTINSEALYGVEWILGNMRQRVINVERPGKGGKEDVISCLLVNNNSRTKPVVMKNGQVGMKVTVDAKVNLQEKTPAQALDPQLYSEVEEAVAGQIKKEIMAGVTAAQVKYKSDFIGYGREIMRHFPKLWAKGGWPNNFQYLPTLVQIKVRVNDSTGRM